MDKNSRLLITGASGMVGQSLLGRLDQEGYRDVLQPTSRKLDLRDQAQTRAYFREHTPEDVFHLAGHIGGIKASILRPVEFMYENLLMALNAINCTYEFEAKKLLFVGSSCIYPKECPQPMKEEHLLSGKLEPTNEGYALAKISGMKLCEDFNKQYGTNFISLMPCNLYGYKDHFEPENSHVVSALIYKMHKAKLRGESSVEVWGSGRSRREFLFVDDFSDAMLHFMSTYDAVDLEDGFVNIGSGKDQTIRELAILIRDVVGYTGYLEFNTEKPDGMPRKKLDVTKATRLGRRNRTELPDGLARTYEWFLQHGTTQ